MQDILAGYYVLRTCLTVDGSLYIQMMIQPDYGTWTAESSAQLGDYWEMPGARRKC